MLTFKFVNKYWTLHIDGAAFISFATLSAAIEAVPEADVEVL